MEAKQINWKVVLAVAAVSAVVMVVALVAGRKPSPDRQRIDISETEHVPSQKENAAEEVGYYLDEAEFFIASLPEDKEVVLRRIDTANHRLYYIEKTRFPSCYCYNLDSRETSVVFSGEEGFAAKGNPYLVKEISDWRAEGNDVIFTAKNGARNRDYTNDALAFYLTTDNDMLHFVDYGSDTYFGNEERTLVVVKARYLRHKFFSRDELYELRRVVYDY